MLLKGKIIDDVELEQSAFIYFDEIEKVMKLEVSLRSANDDIRVEEFDIASDAFAKSLKETHGVSGKVSKADKDALIAFLNQAIKEISKLKERE